MRTPTFIAPLVLNSLCSRAIAILGPALAERTTCPAGVAGVEYGSGSIAHSNHSSADACCESCQTLAACKSWTWISDGSYNKGHNCFLKGNDSPTSKRSARFSGVAVTAPPTPAPPTPVPSPAQLLLDAAAPALSRTDRDGRYVSWTIDTSVGRQFFDIDFAEPKLRLLAAALPTYVRVGGSGNDYLQYFPCASPAPGWGKSCLNQTQWEGLAGFVNASGARMVFGLNICPRAANATGGGGGGGGGGPVPDTTCPTVDGRWDPSNARALLSWSQARGIPFFGLELGNERNSQQTAQSQAADFQVLHALLLELWPSDPPAVPPTATSRPWLLGPDTHSFKDSPSKWPATLQYLGAFADEVHRLGFAVAFHAVTHHEYDEIAEGGMGGRNASRLDLSGRIGAAANATVRQRFPGVDLWAGEIGPHNGGGAPCSHASMRWANFADSLWYADALGSKAAAGYQVFARQDFVGIDYGILDCATHDPLPDYWTALLFHRLMGDGVLALAQGGGGSELRAYAHCARGHAGGVALLLINISPDTSATALLPLALVADGRLEFHLRATNGTAGTGTALNGGAPLALEDGGTRLPALEGALAPSATAPIVLQPLEIAWIVLPNAGVAACQVSV